VVADRRRVAGARGDRGALAFEQVNAGVAEALRASVLAAVPAAARRVLDLYGGTGEVAFALARARRDVVLVEMDRAAARRAPARAGAAPGRVKVVAARVEDAIGGLLPADAVVVNPPRAGLAPAVVAALAARPPGWLVYVSCDPATLARDLARLGARAERLALRCFDMFPQTSHVETLAVLRHGSVEGAGAPEDPSA
jgi:23S rRNA (uracil1939-C5)-methyltransferase